MLRHVFDGHRHHSFRHQPGQPLVQAHAQLADAARVQPQGRGQHQVRSVRFKKVRRAHIGPEPRGNQRYNAHQGVGRLAAFLGEVGYLLQSQNVVGARLFVGLGHRAAPSFRSKIGSI
jgi:hypothetical protein